MADTSVLGPGEILERTRRLVPEIERRTDEIASLRRLPADLVAQLEAAGVFRMSAVAVVLVAAGVTASAAPARRAMRLDPTTALQSE
jgi:ABC-type lipoprotein release transport system permease subunit